MDRADMPTLRTTLLCGALTLLGGQLEAVRTVCRAAGPMDGPAQPAQDDLPREGSPSSSHAGGLTRSIPEEPEEYDRREVKAFYDWRNDLFFRHFDMGRSGRTDFMTARRTYQVWLGEFGNPVVLTMANPLFYWVDLNANGKFESHLGEMWSDPEEDGVNGNERLYDVHDLQGSGPPSYPFAPRAGRH